MQLGEPALQRADQPVSEPQATMRTRPTSSASRRRRGTSSTSGSSCRSRIRPGQPSRFRPGSGQGHGRHRVQAHAERQPVRARPGRERARRRPAPRARDHRRKRPDPGRRWCSSWSTRSGARGPSRWILRHPVRRPAGQVELDSRAAAWSISWLSRGRRQDLADDRGRDGAAVAARVDDHRRGDQLRLAAGAKPVNHASTFCSGTTPASAWPGSSGLGPELGGPGLAGDLDARQRGGGARSLGHDADHQLAQRRRGLASRSPGPARSMAAGRRRGPCDVGLRTPPLATVWATEAISSGVASTSPLADRGHGRGRRHWRSRSGSCSAGGLIAFSA